MINNESRYILLQRHNVLYLLYSIMIRFLAHLLIMLSLGLIFNVNAEASNYKKLDLIFCENDSSRYTGVYIRENVNGKCPNSGYETTDKSRNSYFNVSHLCYVHNNPKRYKVISHESKNCKSFGASKIKFNSVRNEYYTYVKIVKKETRKIVSSKIIIEVARSRGGDRNGDPCVEAKSNATKKALANASKKHGVNFTGNNIISNKVLSRFPDGLYCEIEVEVSLLKYNYEETNSPSENIAKIEEEKRKIEEEKRKIEEEKRKIAEAKKKQEEEKKQKKVDEKLYIIGTGTGFFVSSNGYVVSNEHVVGGCREVATKINGEVIKFKIITTDMNNDIGLIKTDFNNANYLNINPSGADIGEDIVAFGYPLSDKLSSSVKLTRGIVSSLSGPGNNYSLIQIDAAIQPGNSGGPVLNYNSQVVGIASAGLKKVKMLVEEEYIPENVNFAVSASSLTNFLKANDVIIDSNENKVANTKELAKVGIPSTIQLYCLNTKAAHKENKKNNRYSDIMLEKVIDFR